MKAIVCEKYGSPEVLQLKEVAKPTPKDNEVLIRVHAASVNFGDLMARNFKAVSPRQFNMPFLLWLLAKISFGLSQPKITILGSELAGEIEAVGKDVTKLKIGDQVFAHIGMNMGAYAEYVCMSESGAVTLKPVNLSYEEASTLPYGAVMATNLLGKANIQRGQKVLINGASGGIGSMAVQLAKHFGAEVTGVCGTPRLFTTPPMPGMLCVSEKSSCGVIVRAVEAACSRRGSRSFSCFSQSAITAKSELPSSLPMAKKQNDG